MTPNDVRITDSTLRDGSHAIRHTFTGEQVRAVVSALDGAGVEVIEVTHGDGLGGSSFNYGFAAVDDITLVRAAVDEATRAKIAVLLLPGLGTVADLKAAADAGASVVTIASNCTEADVAIQHFGAARDLGMETVGFLMLAHRLDPAGMARQARIMVDAGAQCVYVTDSAGALVLAEAQDRVSALVAEIGAQAEVGFHGHQNLSLGIANSVLAVNAGARQVDGALCALGAGAGNSPTEVLAATFDRLGISTGIDVQGVLAAAEDVLRPLIPKLPSMDRSSVVQGYAGVYSSFLLHAQRAAERYGVPAHAILTKVGEAGYVGGQEDMIIDVALSLGDELDGGADGGGPAGRRRLRCRTRPAHRAVAGTRCGHRVCDTRRTAAAAAGPRRAAGRRQARAPGRRAAGDRLADRCDGAAEWRRASVQEGADPAGRTAADRVPCRVAAGRPGCHRGRRDGRGHGGELRHRADRQPVQRDRRARAGRRHRGQRVVW